MDTASLIEKTFSLVCDLIEREDYQGAYHIVEAMADHIGPDEVDHLNSLIFGSRSSNSPKVFVAGRQI